MKGLEAMTHTTAAAANTKREIRFMERPFAQMSFAGNSRISGHLSCLLCIRSAGPTPNVGQPSLPVPQKLTLWECCEPASIRRLASAQDTLSLPDFRINGLDLGMLEARSLQSVSLSW